MSWCKLWGYARSEWAALPSTPFPQKVAARWHPDDGVAPDLPALQQAAAEQWFEQLLCAARRFIACGKDPATLNPAAARELGFLAPDSKWTDNLGFAARPLRRTARPTDYGSDRKRTAP